MSIYDDLNDEIGIGRSGTYPEFIERCRRDFLATGNPLYVWEAWGAIRFTWRSRSHERIDMPEWVGQYLDLTAKQLFGNGLVDGRPHVTAKPREGPGSIGRALGFGEGLAKAKEHWGGQWDRREQLANRAIEKMWHEGLSLTRAALEMENDEVGPTTERYPSQSRITHAVRNAQRYALRTMQKRLREATGSIPPRSEIVRAYSQLCKARSGALPSRKNRSKLPR